MYLYTFSTLFTRIGVRLYHTCGYIYLADERCVGYTFRRDGRYFLLAERHKSKDTLGVYDTADSYKLVRVRSSQLVP